MLLIILLVVWVMSMFLWLLHLLGAVPQTAAHGHWLSFFAVLTLGIVVFLLGTGAVTWQR